MNKFNLQMYNLVYIGGCAHGKTCMAEEQTTLPYRPCNPAPPGAAVAAGPGIKMSTVFRAHFLRV